MFANPWSKPRKWDWIQHGRWEKEVSRTIRVPKEQTVPLEEETVLVNSKGSSKALSEFGEELMVTT